MDEESKQLLREIRDLQREQMELLRAHLLPPWLRVRFSVRTLLVVMTLTAIALGLIDLRTGVGCCEEDCGPSGTEVATERYNSCESASQERKQRSSMTNAIEDSFEDFY